LEVVNECSQPHESVRSLADIEALPTAKIADDALQITVRAPYGDEQIVAFHPGSIVDSFPIIEFSATFSTVSVRESIPLRALASNLAERNFDARDSGWGFRMTPSGDCAVTISSRMHGGQLKHARFLQTLHSLTTECAAVRQQFLTKTGEIIAFTVDPGQSAMEEDDEVQEDELGMPHWLGWIGRIALLNGCRARYDDDEDLCITLQSGGREITIFVAPANQRSPGEALVRFSSPGQRLITGRDELGEIAYKLMFRNASTLHAHWATPLQDGAGIPLVVKNVRADELDAFRVREIIGSFVAEAHYASAELSAT
jgi:hypothetical protein